MWMRKLVQGVCVTGGILLLGGCQTLHEWRNWVDPDASSQETKAQAETRKNLHYTVHKEDTLYKVARKFNVTERAIILWNNLHRPYLLDPGQVLILFPDKEHQRQAINARHNARALTSTDLKDQSTDHQVITRPSTPEPSPTPIPTPTPPASQQSANAETADDTADKTDSEPAQAGQGPSSSSQGRKRESHNGIYVVQRGDGLISIANSFGLSLTEIATMNDIKPPYHIYVGQELRVKPETASASSAAERSQPSPAPQRPADNARHSTSGSASQTATPEPAASGQGAQTARSPQSGETDNASWQWPLDPPRLAADHNDEQNGPVYLAGQAGQQVYAACHGQVIYAGVGIEGYGKMMIIKCDNGYLSAYSNLDELSEPEGKAIKRGTPIGTLGKFKGVAELGFEVRKQGNFVNPKKLLPPIS